MPQTPEALGPYRWLGPGLLIGAVVLAYANTFAVPFLFDDIPSIVENPTIRRLWSIGDVLSPPVGNGFTVGGRPFLNFTFALNYAVSGMDVWSYHLLNLVIHVAAGLTLFGALRRALERKGTNLPPLAASWCALVVAALWLLHPLQTESVTYVVQRAESLVGLLYLVTLYGFIRAADSARARWYVLSVAACVLGMMTKEVMVTAPLVVLLYDRTFVAGSFRTAFTSRRPYYAALFGTWIILACLLLRTGSRGGSIGANALISPYGYGLTQAAAIVHYLRLGVWPSPLIFDYGTGVVASASDAALQLVIIGALLTTVLVALRRWPAIGFLGACFFLILAPTSSLVPITTQTVAEHRMYLALAPMLALLVVTMHRWCGQKILFALGALAVGAGACTLGRNRDYRSEFSIWQDTAQKQPENPRALAAHGKNLMLQGQFADALPVLERAVRFSPIENSDDRFNLAVTYERLDRPADAVGHFQSVVRVRPDDAEAWTHLGLCQAALNDSEAAIQAFGQSLRLKPGQPRVLFQLGESWFARRDFALAAKYYGESVRLAPNDPALHHFHGLALALGGRLAEAAIEFERALQLRPDYAEARQALARARADLNRTK